MHAVSVTNNFKERMVSKDIFYLYMKVKILTSILAISVKNILTVRLD